MKLHRHAQGEILLFAKDGESLEKMDRIDLVV